MTDQQWQQAAEAFGVAPAHVQHYRDAFSDIQRLGIDTFARVLFVELLAVRAAREAGTPQPAAAVQRLEIRHTVLHEVFGYVEHEALAHYDGPMQ